jgi:hypothetical protein
MIRVLVADPGHDTQDPRSHFGHVSADPKYAARTVFLAKGSYG